MSIFLVEQVSLNPDMTPVQSLLINAAFLSYDRAFEALSRYIKEKYNQPIVVLDAAIGLEYYGFENMYKCKINEHQDLVTMILEIPTDLTVGVSDGT